MICIITIVRYPKYLGFFGVLSMALFHFTLFFNKKISFYKLMGSGKNGTFDIHPDWRQWAILTVTDKLEIQNTKLDVRNTKLEIRNTKLEVQNTKLEVRSTKFEVQSTKFETQNEREIMFEINAINGNFINRYFKFFNCTKKVLLLKPISTHGTWDGKEIFGKMPHNQNSFTGKIAVLTRASIRLNKLKSFWQNVPLVANQMEGANGLITSYGIGEVPFIKQATLSIWDNIDDMKNFAYKMKEHQTVIQKTRKENWYSEEMFTRFEVIYNS